MRKGYRILCGLLLTILVVLAPLPSASAQENSQQKFGGTNCPSKVPCPNTGEYLSASAAAEMGNACIARLGMNLENGFFDESAGLDSNQCLTIRSDVLAQKDNKSILPKCCVIELAPNTCYLHCDLLNNWQ